MATAYERYLKDKDKEIELQTFLTNVSGSSCPLIAAANLSVGFNL